LVCLVFISCYDVQKIPDEMVPVLHRVESLKKFYQKSNRLPSDDSELIKFCAEDSIDLDLSKFSKFHYYLSSDSTITLDYELKSTSKIKGSFSIDI